MTIDYAALQHVPRLLMEARLRLRTACDLCIDGDLTVTQPKDFAVPEEPALVGGCRDLIDACGKAGLFAKPPITTVKWEPEKKSDRKAQKGLEEEEDQG